MDFKHLIPVISILYYTSQSQMAVLLSDQKHVIGENTHKSKDLFEKKRHILTTYALLRAPSISYLQHFSYGGQSGSSPGA